MPENEFKPKLGRIRAQGRAKSARHATRVMEDVSAHYSTADAVARHIDPNAHRRGMASGIRRPHALRGRAPDELSRVRGGVEGPAFDTTFRDRWAPSTGGIAVR
jgi:hypothetical protein